MTVQTNHEAVIIVLGVQSIIQFTFFSNHNFFPHFLQPLTMQLIPKILKRTAGNTINLHTHVNEFTLQLQHVSTQVNVLIWPINLHPWLQGVSIYDRNVARHAATGLYPGELEE